MSDHPIGGAAPVPQDALQAQPQPTPDPHLLAALRHAPDRDASAPAELSHRIAQQARASLQPQPGALARWWALIQTQLAQPVAASAFGTLVLAGFIGLMWRDGVPPEAVPREERSAQAVPAPPPAPAASDNLVTGAATAPVLRARAAAGAAGEVVAPLAAAKVPAVHAPIAPPPTEPAPAVKESAERRAAAAPPAGPKQQPLRDESSLGAVASAAAAARAAAAAEATAQPLQTSPAPASPQTPSLQAQADPLAAPLAQLAAHPGDDPLVLAARDQLVSLQRAARGLWRAAPPPGDAGTTVRDAEGRLLGRLLLRGLDVTWQGSDGTAWRARLPPDWTPR